MVRKIGKLTSEEKNVISRLIEAYDVTKQGNAEQRPDAFHGLYYLFIHLFYSYYTMFVMAILFFNTPK